MTGLIVDRSTLLSHEESLESITGETTGTKSKAPKKKIRLSLTEWADRKSGRHGGLDQNPLDQGHLGLSTSGSKELTPTTRSISSQENRSPQDDFDLMPWNYQLNTEDPLMNPAYEGLDYLDEYYFD